MGTTLGMFRGSKADHGTVCVVTKLPGTNACKSSLGAVWMHNKTQGSSSIQFGPDNLAFSDAFMVLWKRSTKPFAFGLKAVVQCRADQLVVRYDSIWQR